MIYAQDLPEPELDPEVKAAFDVAYDNIRQFHQAQKDKDTELSVETMPGVVCRRVSRPIGAHLLFLPLYLPRALAGLPHSAELIERCMQRRCR